jgi:hypothetical protein
VVDAIEVVEETEDTVLRFSVFILFEGFSSAFSVFCCCEERRVEARERY